ncbi:hypothetical protein AGDE_06816 [Angomonas deanei]|uniref:G-patch domain containing protein, putative n=1 Tax=Angomonas deanei TaxID=59799 RepID=A0A7G2CPH0_9TRYP|nr:hypothetical protein AGDE_06816 [Angomonas deanei]CAD2221680.1 G-patch domain containing protein, putative [Angomonas deanei]|eukprot:EPY36641.1 hypothetical protein AGDE_06816 [Angomonas deanei]
MNLPFLFFFFFLNPSSKKKKIGKIFSNFFIKMSSKFAKNLLLKYGWKEGEALGKNKQKQKPHEETEKDNHENENSDEDTGGMHTYIRVVRRDPKCLGGLGHESDPYTTLYSKLNRKGKNKDNNNNTVAQVHTELDAVYGEIGGRDRKRGRDSSDSDSEEEEKNEKLTKKNKQEEVSSSEDETERQTKKQKTKVKEDSSSSSSSDDDDSEEEEDNNNKNKLLSDEELFRRCGGVRLGRAGRHRFFDGKLSRLDKKHQKEE